MKRELGALLARTCRTFVAFSIISPTQCQSHPHVIKNNLSTKGDRHCKRCLTHRCSHLKIHFNRKLEKNFASVLKVTTERERTSLQFDRYAVGTEESRQVHSSSIQIRPWLTLIGNGGNGTWECCEDVTLIFKFQQKKCKKDNSG